MLECLDESVASRQRKPNKAPVEFLSSRIKVDFSIPPASACLCCFACRGGVLGDKYPKCEKRLAVRGPRR